MFYRFHPFRDKNKPETPGSGSRKPGLSPKIVNTVLAVILVGSAAFSLTLLVQSLWGTRLDRFPVRIQKLWQPSLPAPVPDSTRKDSTINIQPSKTK